MEQLKNQLIKEWGDCLVDRPISLTPDDRRFVQSEYRSTFKKGSAHLHIVFVHNSPSNKKVNAGLVNNFFDEKTLVYDVDVQTIHYARKWVHPKKDLEITQTQVCQFQKGLSATYHQGQSHIGCN